MAETLEIGGFTYFPDQGRWNPGIINRYEFKISVDGRIWGKAVSEGEFVNFKNSPVLQKKEFELTTGRFAKFLALSL